MNVENLLLILVGKILIADLKESGEPLLIFRPHTSLFLRAIKDKRLDLKIMILSSRLLQLLKDRACYLNPNQVKSLLRLHQQLRLRSALSPHQKPLLKQSLMLVQREKSVPVASRDLAKPSFQLLVPKELNDR